jgi:hypothetical protein
MARAVAPATREYDIAENSDGWMTLGCLKKTGPRDRELTPSQIKRTLENIQECCVGVRHREKAPAPCPWTPTIRDPSGNIVGEVGRIRAW